MQHIIAQLYEQILSYHKKIEVTLNGQELPERTNIDGVHTAYGMYFQYSFDVKNYGYENDGNTRRPEWQRRFIRHIHVIITRSHNVFVAVSSERCLNQVQMNEWENTSNHDSCWKSDGLQFIQQTIFDAYHECFDHMPEEHKPAPIAMHLLSRLGDGLFSHEVLKFVRVDFVNANPRDSYRKQLIKVVPVKFSLNIIDEDQQ